MIVHVSAFVCVFEGLCMIVVFHLLCVRVFCYCSYAYYHLTHTGMLKALRAGLKNKEDGGHCHACWSGEYPIDIEDTAAQGPKENSCGAKHTPSF